MPSVFHVEEVVHDLVGVCGALDLDVGLPIEIEQVGGPSGRAADRIVVREALAVQQDPLKAAVAGQAGLTPGTLPMTLPGSYRLLDATLILGRRRIRPRSPAP